MRHKSFFAVGLAMALVFGAASAFAERTAKAVFDTDTLIFKFYYDEIDYSGENIIVYSVPENGSRPWGTPNTMTQVVFDVSFKDFRPKTLANWFTFGSIKEFVGLEYLNTSEVTSMSATFRYAGATELDLSMFDFQKVTDINSLVNSMTGLKTVYVAPDFALRSDISQVSPFGYSYSLVGGEGSKWSSSNSSIEYFRIDRGESEPGYLTEKIVELPPEIYSVTEKSCTESAVTMEVRGRFYQASGSITIEVKAGDAVVKHLEVSSYGDVEITGLESSTDYHATVTAENDYGETVDDTFDFTTLDPPSVRWFYNKSAGVISNSVWRFAASVAKNTHNLTVGAVQAWPDEPQPLDFSKQVTDVDGFTYTIVKLDTYFGESTSQSGWYPAGRFPQCEKVGALTFPKRLETLENYSFIYCTNMSIVGGFPATLDRIGDGVFCGTRITGDLVLTNLSSTGIASFKQTEIGSVVFGPKLTHLGGNYNRGTFQSCSYLSNIVFHADSSWDASYGGNFSGCSSLKELNMQGYIDASISILSGTSVTNVVFPAKLQKITVDAFTSASSLINIVFEGAVPDTMDAPLYTKLSNSRTVTTHVPFRLLSVTNSSGKCWLDYAENGLIARKNTTWAEAYTGGAELYRRPLLTIPLPGLKISLR